ncbi:MAG: peroxide stress protein YaaA [Flavobacteriaceae bacterium]|nr:peroxide stress protein YaaA [Flavobacteriaceae bacterium]
MKIVISPAKSLDFETTVPTQKYTEAIFLKEAQVLSNILKKKSPEKIGELMHISTALSELNWQRNQDWRLPFDLENARQAVFAFKGEVFLGMDAYSLSEDKILVLQDKLRILSGQYGVLKPLDLMQAYRLEMGTKLKIRSKDNLYKYWGTKITEALNTELTEEEVFVNLASNEYFKSVQVKNIKVPVITPVFKDYKNEKLKVISFFAKKARGLMVRFILDNNIETVEGLKTFNSGGYGFDQKLSTDMELVFTR